MDTHYTKIVFGSSTKGYSSDKSDSDIIYFERRKPVEYVSEFVRGTPLKNVHKEDDADVVWSTELIGLRGIMSGKYAHLAVFQNQIPQSKLKDLVHDLGNEYAHRIYAVVRRKTIDPKCVRGKNALQQLFSWQMAEYIKLHGKLPGDVGFKMPQCFELTNMPHLREKYENYMSRREEQLSEKEVDEFFKMQPIENLNVHCEYDDEKYEKMIFDYVMSQ